MSLVVVVVVSTQHGFLPVGRRRPVLARRIRRDPRGSGGGFWVPPRCSAGKGDCAAGCLKLSKKIVNRQRKTNLQERCPCTCDGATEIRRPKARAGQRVTPRHAEGDARTRYKHRLNKRDLPNWSRPHRRGCGRLPVTATAEWQSGLHRSASGLRR